jgi:hypothetical protein
LAVYFAGCCESDASVKIITSGNIELNYDTASHLKPWISERALHLPVDLLFGSADDQEHSLLRRKSPILVRLRPESNKYIAAGTNSMERLAKQACMLLVHTRKLGKAKVKRGAVVCALVVAVLGCQHGTRALEGLMDMCDRMPGLTCGALYSGSVVHYPRLLVEDESTSLQRSQANETQIRLDSRVTTCSPKLCRLRVL